LLDLPFNEEKGEKVPAMTPLFLNKENREKSIEKKTNQKQAGAQTELKQTKMGA